MDYEHDNLLTDGAPLWRFIWGLIVMVAIIGGLLLMAGLTAQALFAAEKHLLEGFERSDQPEQKTESASVGGANCWVVQCDRGIAATEWGPRRKSLQDEACSVRSPQTFPAAGNFGGVVNDVCVRLVANARIAGGCDGCGESLLNRRCREAEGLLVVKSNSRNDKPLPTVLLWSGGVESRDAVESPCLGLLKAPRFSRISDRPAPIHFQGREGCWLPNWAHNPNHEGSIPSPAPNFPAQTIDGCRTGEDAAKQSGEVVIALGGRAPGTAGQQPEKHCICDEQATVHYFGATTWAMRRGSVASGDHRRPFGNRIKAGLHFT